jgi:hypothetical protein
MRRIILIIKNLSNHSVVLEGASAPSLNALQEEEEVK